MYKVDFIGQFKRFFPIIIWLKSSAPSKTAPKKTMKTLDKKLENFARGKWSRKDFIIADAKDADMAFGIRSGGIKPDGTPLSAEEYREKIRNVIRQAKVDIVLMSASNLEHIAVDEGLFRNSSVTPAARANDATDVWAVRWGSYTSKPSRPFRSADINSIKYGCPAPKIPPRGVPGADLGLYSTTFNNDIDSDAKSLEAFDNFTLEASAKNFRYFWEVFNPNVDCGLDKEKIPQFVNDCIVRSLAGLTKARRPKFLKVVYNGPAAMEELASYDASMPVGILGGSSGTTFEAFNLLQQAQKYGARVALFGRRINASEDQLSFIECLRAVADGDLSAREAVKLYHDMLGKKKIRPLRTLEEDLSPTLPPPGANSYASR